MVTAIPVRNCCVPEMMTVSPSASPFTTCTSASVRMPVTISVGSALPERYRNTLSLPISGTMACEGMASASLNSCFFSVIEA